VCVMCVSMVNNRSNGLIVYGLFPFFSALEFSMKAV
jgi:hypothetical protein